MRKSAIKRKDLITFCKRHSIFIPNERTVKVEYLVSAIHRMLMHGKTPELTVGCYGYWAEDDMNCETCDFSDKCFEKSMGMKKEDYENKYEKSGDKILNSEEDYRK